MNRPWSLLALLSLTAACGPPAVGPTTPTGDDAAAKIAALQTVEDDVLRDIAASDRRFAARAKITPRDDDARRLAMGAVLAEDASLAAVDGAIDPFSFEARGRGLAKARQGLDRIPAGLPEPAALEGELLARVVDEETQRLEEERRLPRSASALLRAVIDTWTPPSAPDRAAEKDRWLSRRLAEITKSIEEKPLLLDVGRARELDDALDALEHFIDQPGFARSMGELVKLRDKLEAQGARPPPAAVSDWDAVSKGIRAHLGMFGPPEVLDGWLAEVQKQVRPRAEAAVALAKIPTEVLATRVAAIIATAGEPCVDGVAGSILRSMPPPTERVVACRLRHALANGSDEAARAVGLIALHDAVVVARWSVDVARGVATLAQSSGRHRPLSRQAPDVAARWERIALARPVVAIGGGLAAVALYGTKGDEALRAKKWSQLGDVPIDLAVRELH